MPQLAVNFLVLKANFISSSSEIQDSCSLILKYAPEPAWIWKCLLTTECGLNKMRVPSLLMGHMHNPLSFMGDIFHRAFRPPDYFSITDNINRALAEMKQITPPLWTQQKFWDRTPWNLYLYSKGAKLWSNLLANMPLYKVSLLQYAHIHFFHITSHFMACKKFQTCCHWKQKIQTD